MCEPTRIWVGGRLNGFDVRLSDEELYEWYGIER